MGELSRVTVEVPKDLAERLNRRAADRQETPEALLGEALAQWLDRADEEDRLLDIALAEADAGLVVDHERVVAWIASLGTDNPMPMPKPYAPADKE